MQLSPREKFTIVRGLEDHTVATVFYVRATIRNAKTDALLDTVNLTNSGDNQRYSVEYTAPLDSTGQGTWIVITTSVYTDSGYTTKSTTYGDKYDEYLVQERFNASTSFNNAGMGADIDYKRIQKMIDEVRPLPQKEIIIPEVDTQSILNNLVAVREMLATMMQNHDRHAMEMPKADYSSILNRIDAIKIPQPSETFNDLLQPIQELSNKISDVLDEKVSALHDAGKGVDTATERIQEFFIKDVDEIKSKIDALSKQFDEINCVMLKSKGSQ